MSNQIFELTDVLVMDGFRLETDDTIVRELTLHLVGQVCGCAHEVTIDGLSGVCPPDSFISYEGARQALVAVLARGGLVLADNSALDQIDRAVALAVARDKIKRE